MMLHKHHIIPKHVGGSDDPSNLVELTIEEHAEAHRVLYEQYGRREDLLAWKGLLGRLGREQIIRERCSIGGKNSHKSKLARGLPIGAQAFTKEQRVENSRRAGKVSTNANAKWWFNGTHHRFCADQPNGYIRSTAPNNCGKSTKNTVWWNDGQRHKRSAQQPGSNWVVGRINNGNLGGSRKAS